MSQVMGLVFKIETQEMFEGKNAFPSCFVDVFTII